MRQVLLLVTIWLLLTATPAFAEYASWEAPPPKGGMAGGAVIWCTATAESSGDRYTLVNWAPTDEGFDSERYARRVFSEDVARAMLFRFEGRPHVIQPSDVTVTCGKPR